MLAIDRLKTEFKQTLKPVFAQWKLVFIVFLSVACLIFLEYFVIRGVFAKVLSEPLMALGRSLDLPGNLLVQLGWAVGCVVTYCLVPILAVKLVLRESLSGYGLSMKGYCRHLPLYLLLVSPILLAILGLAGTKEFQHTYPFYFPRNGKEFLIWEFAYICQFIALEFFFRGFMVHGLRRHIGDLPAVMLMVLPYMMIHFPKPWLETTGAVFAGVVLGLLSIRTRSIWGGVTVHVMVALSMDFLSLYHQGWFATGSN